MVFILESLRIVCLLLWGLLVDGCLLLGMMVVVMVDGVGGGCEQEP